MGLSTQMTLYRRCRVWRHHWTTTNRWWMHLRRTLRTWLPSNVTHLWSRSSNSSTKCRCIAKTPPVVNPSSLRNAMSGKSKSRHSEQLAARLCNSKSTSKGKLPETLLCRPSSGAVPRQSTYASPSKSKKRNRSPVILPSAYQICSMGVEKRKHMTVGLPSHRLQSTISRQRMTLRRKMMMLTRTSARSGDQAMK